MRVMDFLRERATATSPRVHGNGFIQFDVNNRVRMHVWHDGIPRQTTDAPIHDHTFGFTSLVVVGALINRLYREEPWAPDDDFTPQRDVFQPHQAQTRDGDDTVLVPHGAPTVLTIQSEEQIAAQSVRDNYMMWPGQIHESRYAAPAISIIVKTGPTLAQGGAPPRVFVRQSVVFPNDFHRHHAMTADDMWGMIHDMVHRDVESVAIGLAWALELERLHLFQRLKTVQTFTTETARIFGAVGL